MVRKNQIFTQNLSKSYYQNHLETQALQGVNISIVKGDFVAVAGPSGSGKSTLLYLLGGLIAPTTGKIWIEEKEITAASFDLSGYRLREVGFIFQDFNLMPTLSVLENVEYTMLLQGIDAKSRYARAIAILEEVGLKEFMKRRPAELSGGQQQRVAVARAIAAEPQIILADEPTANLDSHTAKSLISLMKSLNKEKNITFIFATHDETIMAEADYVLRLRDGKIISS
jgi:putative ABC transport system ATP-binding protein